MASKEILSSVDLSKISRDEFEKNLSFVSVVNFKNVLPDERPETIRELQNGKVCLVMITGDSLLTGIVAPFTSLDKSIHLVVEVLREGRCALASAFVLYKYTIMYGQVETINQLINEYFQIMFTD
jgi:magnesium-transporting ATPase (P-type)